MITIEKESFKFIAILVILAAISLFVFRPAAVFFLVLAAGVMLFFRETKRDLTFTEPQIVSPASGKVIDICRVFEPDFLKTEVLKVSIFMSVLDEHINYAPIPGEVAFLSHRAGGFKRAYLGEAAEVNEAQKIGLRNGETACLVKQIAGVIARRIVCRCRLGDRLKAGEKFGMIRFGSRVDLFLPLTAELSLKVGDKVRGGRTVIGEIR